MNKIKHLIPNISLGVASLALLSIVVFVFGATIGFWEPIVGFMYYRNFNDLIGYAVCGVSLLSIIYSFKTQSAKGKLKLVVSLMIGLTLLAPTITANIIPPVKYPPIHDITTNIDAPPSFEFLKDDRPGAKNSLVYGGEKVAVMQKEAYPEIKPIFSSLDPHSAYQKAIVVAQAMGWDVIYHANQSHKFESIARTPFFHFADDIVVRVTPSDKGSRIDLRSVSRIGRSDRGVNAKRISEFTQEFLKY